MINVVTESACEAAVPSKDHTNWQYQQVFLQNLNIREGDSSWIWDIYVVLRLWLNARIW